MRSGAAAKLRLERIRMQRMSVEKLAAPSLDQHRKDKDEDERRMMTPWRSRIVVGLEALPLILLSPCLIKLLRLGLYDGEDSSILRAKIYICVAAAVGEGMWAMGGLCRVLSAVATGNCRASPGWTGEGARPHTN